MLKNSASTNSFPSTRQKACDEPELTRLDEQLHHLDIEELLHHLDVEELGHDELLRFDEQLRLAVTSLRDLLVSQGGHYLLEWLQMHLLSECRLV